jgi:hypothetical protein
MEKFLDEEIESVNISYNETFLKNLVNIKDSLISNLNDEDMNRLKVFTNEFKKNLNSDLKNKVSEFLKDNLSSDENKPGTVAKVLSNCISGDSCLIVRGSECVYVYDINTKKMSPEITGNVSNTALIRVESNYNEIPNSEIKQLINNNKNIQYLKIEYRDGKDLDYSYKIINNIDDYLNEDKNNLISVVIMISIIFILIFMFRKQNK